MQKKQSLKCGIYTWFGFVVPFEEKLRMIKDAGFDTICTWWDDLFSENDGKKRKHFQQALDAGLYLEHTHLPYFGCDALWKDSIDGDDLTNIYCKGIEEAADCEIRTVVMHPFEINIPEDGEWEIFWKHIQKIADKSEEKEVRLAVENLANRKSLMRIINAFAENPFVGLCFDTGHNNLVNTGDFGLLEWYADKIFALHIHDNNSAKDQHILPYQGNIDWKIFAHVLKQTEFDGSLMLETCYPMDMEKLDSDPSEYIKPPIPPEEYLAEAKKSCDRLREEFYNE